MESNDSTVQIIPYYAQPHVHTVIRDHTWYDETVYTSEDIATRFSTVVVAGADRGIDNKFIRLTDLATKRAIFGLGDYDKYGQPSIQADQLFNGSTAVWFCRVLPENATYANMVLVAYYRAKDQVDENGDATGLKEMQVKFDIKYLTTANSTEGAKNDSVIDKFAQELTEATENATTKYLAVPLMYIRATGRGRYGNGISIAITRDWQAENDYSLKMFDVNVIDNTSATNKTLVTNIIAGSLFQVQRNGVSMFLEDVVDQYNEGVIPVTVIPYEDSFFTLYNFYKDNIVAPNATYLSTAASVTEEQAEDLKFAQNIIESSFDPLFGYKLKTTLDEKIPYYKNYTVKPEGVFQDPSLPAATDADIPDNVSGWSTAAIDSTVLVASSASKEGKRWLYTVIGIDSESGDITYNEGVEVALDAEQYNGVDIAANAGNTMLGGHDGDFQEIDVDGSTRKPSAAEMKLLLSKEYVKAFRGELDRKILSPAKMDLDFIFDANYNMTSDEDIELDQNSTPLYSNSTVLTDTDAQQLSVLGTTTSFLQYTDINVKQAIYDLNEFRNKRGMTLQTERGAGCSVYFDCNLIGLKTMNVDYELEKTLAMFENLDGRACSIDLGYYEIYNPRTMKKIKVTATYFIASNLIPHLITYGINKPFVYDYARLTAIQKTNAMGATGNMIKGSFKPELDLIDWDIKEKLYKSRINWYVTEDEGRLVRRACQNTRQLDASALLEENNVRVLNALTKNLDRDCSSFLYNWNEPTVRQGFTKAEMEKYRNWKGTYVQDLNIYFDANQWEQERMIMHCYCSVKFRDIIKRIILEINVQRPTYGNGTTVQYS